MATSLLPSQPFVVRASAVSDNTRRKTSTSAAATGGGGKWWSPLFGWSADADYIDSTKSEEAPVKSEEVPAKPKFTRGCFTEEKARQLRLMTKETAAFHDKMYHSAIASRLASDFSAHDSDRQ